MEISLSNRAQSNIENIAEFSLKISTSYANKVVNEIYSTIIISGKQNSNLFFEVHKKEIFNF